jgi:hypothetical protein
MKYILDASVAFKWEVFEADSDKANRLRDDFRNGIHELLAPDFFPWNSPTPSRAPNGRAGSLSAKRESFGPKP